MKSKLVVLLSLTGFTLFGLASPAMADIVEVTFTGTVISSFDTDNVYGCGTNCSITDNPYRGYGYTANFVFNTDVGVSTDNDTQITVQGGTSYPAPSPPSPLISDTATITPPNGAPFTISVDPSVSGFLGIFTNELAPNALPYTLNAVASLGNGDQLYDSIKSSSIPFSLTDTFAPVSAGGEATVSWNCGVRGPFCDGFIQADLTVSLTRLSTVPEPSTWTMMLIGFAGLCFVGRASRFHRAGSRTLRRQPSTDRSPIRL
jgi:hypothetical protein